jgi:hypothetical protein
LIVFSNGSQSRESEPPPTAAATPTLRPYPNPGFQGSLSSAAIFSHISPRHHEPGPVQPEADSVPAGVSVPALLDNDDIACRQGTSLIKLLLEEYPLSTLKDLVSFWLAKGISLSHAESLLDSCVDSMDEALNFGQPTDTCMEHLTRNSQSPLLFGPETSFNAYAAQFSGHNARLETLGIFLSAVVRATNDVPFFPTLYKSDEDKFRLRKLAARLSDHALEVCLTLDCLNDLQLAFQYENFIVHTFVDGDQSYSSWRRLGDVIASMLALGYHERVETRSRIPNFLVELRQSAFARIYTDDKEVSIFLGRPPRLSRRFCHFRIPIALDSFEVTASAPGTENGQANEIKIDYRAGCSWAALCALLKEEILELFIEKNREHCVQRASIICAKAEAQWQQLPTHMRYDVSCLNDYRRSPFERDFLISARLDHIHIRFLVRFILLNSLAQPDDEMIQIAHEMLTLVVQAVLARDRLANSGSGLVWKVILYGLPASGIILLAILEQRNPYHFGGLSRAKVLQNLRILVAEIQIGALSHPREPNFALLTRAAQTIENFLDSEERHDHHPNGQIATHHDAAPGQMGPWASNLNLEAWDFDLGFWENLAEHPFLSNLEFPT